MSDYFSKENKILIGNILDKYNKYNETGINTYSNFLNQAELSIITKYLDARKIKYNVYPEYDFLEKKIIVFGEYLDYITFYKVEIPSDIKHSNILGTLFSLGLDNDMIGDIYVEDGYFYLTNLTRMNKFLEQEFLSIKGCPIKLKEVEEIVLEKDHFLEFNVVVNSYRLDNIVSKITNKSRSIITEMILNKEIALNYHDISSSNTLLKEDDILSIRHFGKYKIGKMIGQTKKNKNILEIVKYV